MDDIRPFLFFAYWVRGALCFGIPGLIIGWLAVKAGRRWLGYGLIGTVVTVGSLLAITIATSHMTTA